MNTGKLFEFASVDKFLVDSRIYEDSLNTKCGYFRKTIANKNVYLLIQEKAIANHRSDYLLWEVAYA